MLLWTQNLLLLHLLSERSQHVRDTWLHFDHIFEDDFLFCFILLLQTWRAMIIIICLLQFVSLPGNIHFVAGRLIGIVVLFQGLNFIDALRASVSTCIGHVLHPTGAHLRAIIFLASNRLLNRVFTVQLSRSCIIEILVLNGNWGSLGWHKLYLRPQHFIFIVWVDNATFTFKIGKTIASVNNPLAWHVIVGWHAHARYAAKLLALERRDGVEDRSRLLINIYVILTWVTAIDATQSACIDLWLNILALSEIHLMPLYLSSACLSLHLHQIDGPVQLFWRQQFLFVEVGFALPRKSILHQFLQSFQLFGLFDTFNGLLFGFTGSAFNFRSGTLCWRAI